jgi:hypothetical protein
MCPRQVKLLCQPAPQSTIKTIPETADIIDVWPALATCFVKRSFEFGCKRKEGTGILF